MQDIIQQRTKTQVARRLVICPEVNVTTHENEHADKQVETFYLNRQQNCRLKQQKHI